MKQHRERFAEIGNLEVRALDEGGWYISKLEWNGMEVVDDDSGRLSAGWEVNLNGRRFTPHLPGVSALDPTVETTAADRVLVFPNEILGLGCLEMELKIDRSKPLLWQRARLTNTSAEPMCIDRINFAQIKLAPAFLNSIQMKTCYASRDADSSAAPLGIDDPAIALELPGKQKGLLIGSLAPGLLRRFSPGMYFSIGYSHGEVRFEKVLNPGESFVSDWAFFLFYEGDPSDSSHWLVENRLRQRPFEPPLTYCSWIPFLRNIDETNIRTQIERAADLGFEVFLIDDGWQNRCGDWEADPIKFPAGLEPLCDLARSRGMSLGLWIGLNTVHPDSWVARERQEWLLKDSSGTIVHTDVAEGRMLLACLDSDFGDWILEKMTDMVARWNLRYLKIDLPLVQDVYFQPPILCHGQNHGHRTPHGYTWNVYRRLKVLCEKLHERFPDLILDLTFEVWGAFHAIDYAMIQWADVTWASNLGDSIAMRSNAPAEARRLLDRRRHLFPPEHVLTGSLRCDSFCQEASIQAALEGYPCLLGDLAALDSMKRSSIQNCFALYKTRRVGSGASNRHHVANS